MTRIDNLTWTCSDLSRLDFPSYDRACMHATLSRKNILGSVSIVYILRARELCMHYCEEAAIVIRQSQQSDNHVQENQTPSIIRKGKATNNTVIRS